MSHEKCTASDPAPGSGPISQSDRVWLSALKWSEDRPILAIALVSFLAVLVNCYPIIFCGRSLVSPMSSPPQSCVYDGWPPMPGMEQWASNTSNLLHSAHGSDVTATELWGIPAGFIASHSLLEHGEIPLWNRYSRAGDSFIGQAVSMLGDPLHLIVIFGKGSAGAWDAKYLASKFLFSFGSGWLVLRLLRHRILSLIFAALAAYHGAYFYINSHLIFFVFGYAPWILLAAVEWLDLRSLRPVRWALIWLLANVACFNAGHVEVSVVLISGLNLAAFANALIEGGSWSRAIRVAGRMGLVTVLFLGLTAPVWLSFLGSLAGSWNAHEKIEVRQLSPVLLAGAFDDIFYLLLRADDSLAALAPGTSLLILVGCVYSALRWRQLSGKSFFWVNTAAVILWGGCIFGWVPAPLIAAIPLLNRVNHNFADFSFLLVIHLTIQAAYGFLCLVGVESRRRMAIEFVCLGGVFVGLIGLYSVGYWHLPIPWTYIGLAVGGALGAPLLFLILKTHGWQWRLLGWAGILLLGFLPQLRFGFYTFGDDAIFMRPGPRVVLNAPSAAITRIKTDQTGAFRVSGWRENLFGDYSAVYELEDIHSCAPLANANFMELVQHFPGIEPKGWIINLVDPIQAQPLLNLLNIKYVLGPTNIQVAGRVDFRLIDRSDFAVLENLQVWPRAFFASQVLTIDSNEEFTRRLSEGDRHPFVALTSEEIKKEPRLQWLGTNQSVIVPASNYRLSVNATGFDIHAPSSGIVCLTEGQARDFKATVNGVPGEVLTVNRAFKGLFLAAPGDYHLTFIYRPHHWLLACTGFWLSVAGAMVMVLNGWLAGQKAGQSDGSDKLKTNGISTH